MVSSNTEPVLPKGSLVLVTGATGYIGSHVVCELLKAGYKARGTARSHEKAENSEKFFNNNPNYSTAIVEDFQHEGSFDEALQGVDAVIHVASDVSFSPDPNQVIPNTIAGVKYILESAVKAGTVKRFVLTSSSAAVLLPRSNIKFSVGANDWNQEAIDMAWAPPPYEQERAFPVYAASKAQAEQALWEFVKNEKPNFVANAVLPNCNMGKILSSPGPTGGCVPSVYKGDIPPFPPQYMIDVIDNARIHVIAAVMDGSLKNERIFSFNQPFNWTDIINIIKEEYPNAKGVAEPPKDEGRDLSKVPNELGAELLKKWYNQETGYKPMRQTVKENLEVTA